ncbi:polysaccharide metabolism, partial [Escherichia coli TW00353]
YLSHYLV